MSDSTARQLYLGGADNHDCGACLVEAGLGEDFTILGYLSEERLSRVKQQGGFPSRAVAWLAGRLEDRAPASVCCCWASTHTPSAFFRVQRERHRRAREGASEFSSLFPLYNSYLHAARLAPLRAIEAAFSRRALGRELTAAGFPTERVELCDHHLAHAAGAYYTSGFEHALVVSMDAVGDGLDCAVYLGRGRELEPLATHGGREAIGCFYARVTEVLGFRPNRHEGKVTGLAAHGRPQAELQQLFGRLFSLEPGRIRLRNDERALRRAAGRFSREDLAHNAQRHLEQEVCRFCRHFLAETGASCLALAGGLFANVLLNQRLYALPGVERIHVFPHMGDGGLALGAVLARLRPRPRTLTHLYHGPEYSEEECGAALERAGLRYRRERDVEAESARLLAEGKTVGRFSGRLEWGPRALGNRSVLVHAGDPTVQDWLNRKLRRTEFMPFAPLTLAEEARDCYRDIDGAWSAARFMTITLDCEPALARSCPAVVYVDGTARPQVIEPEANPALHRLLRLYHERTGIPTVINTSFNMHEEPIVCAPADAIAAFRAAGLDALALGPFLVELDNNPIRR